MIRVMSHYLRTGSAMGNRGVARSSGVWEVVGVLAAVVPCGIFAGLYLATTDLSFLIACSGFAIAAVGIVFFRSPGLFRLKRWRDAGKHGDARGGRFGAGTTKLAAAASAVSGTFTLRLAKLIGLVVWLLAWGVTAALFAKVAENANIGMLMTLVAVGGFSPVVIYFGLESGVKKLGSQLREDD